MEALAPRRRNETYHIRVAQKEGEDFVVFISVQQAMCNKKHSRVTQSCQDINLWSKARRVLHNLLVVC